MPLAVIILKKVPQALRGDLTKWMQEISTGIYVGNLNTRIREELWQRVIDHVKDGEAIISYYKRGELGYDFLVHNGDIQKKNFDGLPLVYIPLKNGVTDNNALRSGFSKASKYHKLNSRSKHTGRNGSKPHQSEYVVVDIETTGLNPITDKIIEIGAVKIMNEQEELFSTLIKIDDDLPPNIIKLTGINNIDLQKSGIPLKEAIEQFIEFIQDHTIVGYSIRFDVDFLNCNLENLGMGKLTNKTIDIKKYVKMQKMNLSSYKLNSVLQAYGINYGIRHRAIEDARLTKKLCEKVNEIEDIFK